MIITLFGKQGTHGHSKPKGESSFIFIACGNKTGGRLIVV